MELNPDLQEKKIFLIEGLKRTYKVQYDAIQPLPYVKDRLYCVDKVFVEGGFEVCLAPELTRGTRGSWERLESYKSIYTDLRFKSKRRIIQGEPGYGKSTLTLQLAYDWCNDVSNSPINNVEILILLRLRQLGSVKSLFRAIKSFLLFQEPRVNKHEIEKIIHSCSSVHIILDGYDEYPGRDSNDNDEVHRIIKMELFADFDVSLTTRYLPESLRQETKRAKLTGFDDKAKDEYIRKAVVGNNDEAVEKIKQRLYENSILADLCQVPLIFVMFAHMAHDQRDFMKFKSVTQFFKHILRCFYEHLKQKFKDNRSNVIYLHAMEHHELDKIAFEGLNKKNQQLSWNKTEFCERVEPESYHQYILIGILVEEDVVSHDSTGGNVLFTTEVRFYHKLFCEWYAAHHLVTLVKSAYDINQTLRFLDPVDLQYLFRFACGLDPDAGKKLINHLKRLPGGDTFAILCILEQNGDVNDIMDSVKDLCSRDVKIQKGDSALLQRSTTQLLEIASNNDIPISGLHLEYSSIKSEGDTIILHSGIPLPILPTVEKIHIAASNTRYGNTGTLTDNDLLNFFHYGMKCGRVKKLMFDQFQLPTSFSPGAFTDTMKTQNTQVCWRPFDIEFHLDEQNGHWEVDDIQVILNKNSGTVSLSERNDILQDTSTLQLLEVARNHDIPVSILHLEYSSMKFEGDTIILHSGIPLPIYPTVEKIHIDASNTRHGSTGTLRENMFSYRNLYQQQYEDEQDMENFDMDFDEYQYLEEHNPETLTDNDLLNLFHYGMKCGRVNELMFNQFQLPTSVSPEAFTDKMKTEKIQVRWRPFDMNFHLDLETGHWEVDNIDILRRLCAATVHIRKSDDTFKQKYTIMFINIASRHEIPISCLHLEYSSIKLVGDTIILHSGIPLPILPTVGKIHIAERNIEYDNTESLFRASPYRRHGNAQYGIKSTLTNMDVLNLFHYGMKCGHVKKLMFDQLQLPISFSPEAFTGIMKTQKTEVRWRPFDIHFHLDLETGHWEVDNNDTLRQLCSDTVYIKKSDGILKQTSTIILIHIASSHKIPISCLHLDYSSIKFEGDTIMLHSGISLPILPTVEKIHIAGSNEHHDNTETLPGLSYGNQYGRPGIFQYGYFEHRYLRHDVAQTLTEKDILNWFRYGMKFRRIKELMFSHLQLPTSVSPEAITDIMKTCDIRVRRRLFDIDFHLDLQNGHWEVDNIDTLRQRCSDTIHICKSDDILKQTFTVMFIHSASRQEIPISCLYLNESFSKIDAGDVILSSGVRLSCPVSVKKVVIDTERGREMTETEVVDILMFVQQSHVLEELDFSHLQLPTSVSPEAITDIMKTRDIRVRWRPFDIDFHLDLQNGSWEFDNIDILRQLCPDTINIRKSDDTFKQKYTIMFINIASNHEIPISCLYLFKSFFKIDAGDVILHSGLRMSCPVSVKKIVIETEKGREMSKTEVVDILMFVQQSHMLKELKFWGCLLPQSIPAESIPSILKSRNVKVKWKNEQCYYGKTYTLNLQSGRWMHRRQEMTDTDYNDTVIRLRD